MLYKAYSWNMMAHQISQYGTNCFPTLVVGNITKVAIFEGED